MKGEKGDTGPQGEQGIQGEKGEKGDTGATGPQGPAGKDGIDGQNGKDGADGSDAEVTASNIKAALGYTPADESIVDELKSDLDALGQASTTEYETVDSVDDMTDTTKQYVMNGTLWAYSETSVYVENNEYNQDTAKFNYRLNSRGAESAYNGMLLTDYIEVDYADKYQVTINGIEQLVVSYGSLFSVDYYDENKTKLAQKVNGNLGIDNSSNTLPITFNLFYISGLESTKFVRMRLNIKTNTETIASSDCEGLVINFEPKNGYKTKAEWTDTGLTPSTGGGSGNYVALLEKINQNTSDISEVSERVTALETGSETLTIPSFWQSAVDECIAKIKALQVGKNCITFPFFSDNHQRNGYSGMMIAYIMKECNIPYCFFGGDSISSGTIADEATMIEQDGLFDSIMSYVPNEKMCRAVGNHDGYWTDGTNKYYYNREQIYELFLREESVAQNKHFGDDGTYYYADDIASKTRFIVMNTNKQRVDNVATGESIDDAQLDWLENKALSFDESGWAVVFIGHAPITNNFHALISNAQAVQTLLTNYINGSSTNKADVVGWFSGHIHRDRFYKCDATGNDQTEDENPVYDASNPETDTLPWMTVTITSDATNISYDASTKHSIANDDQSHAIDFVTINKTTRTVNLTRLGIGEDRSYTY